MSLVSPHIDLRRILIGRMSSLHHEHDSYKWWVLFSVMIGTFMAVLDATIVNVALPKIMATFGVSVDKIEWVVTAYLLVFAVMLPTSGWLADRFGYKRIYFSALLLFTFGSFLCGLAWDEDALIVARIVQGTGAGLLMPVGMAIITRAFPVRQRGLALGFWAISAAASVSLGPLVGGYLVDNLNWNAIFDVNVPVGLFGMLATLVIQREYKHPVQRGFDFIGFISMAISLSSLLIALADGNAAWNTGGWTSPLILTCFAISAISLAIFLYTEFTVEHPLIELALMKDFNFAVTNAILFVFGLGMFGSTFLMPLFLQNSLGYTALQSGAVFLPVGIAQTIFSPLAGIMADKFSPKIPAGIGIALLTYSLYLNSQMSLYIEHGAIIYSLIIRGIAMGLLFTPLSTLALADIPKPKMAQASGLFNVIRQIGGSFGVAIMGSLLTRRVLHHMTMYGQAVDTQSPTYQFTNYKLLAFAKMSVGGNIGESMMRAKAMIIGHLSAQAFVDAINDDFLLSAAITVTGLIPIFFLRARHAKAGKGEPKPVSME